MARHLSSKAGQVFSYRVSENIEKDKTAPKAGQRTAGLKSVIPLFWIPGLSVDDGRNGWQVHGTIALRTHVGMSKYVRNLVEEVLSEGAPAYHRNRRVAFRERRRHALPPDADAAFAGGHRI